MSNEVRININTVNKTRSDFDAVKKDALMLKDVMVSIESKNMTKSDFLKVKKDAGDVKDVSIKIKAIDKTKEVFEFIKIESAKLKENIKKIGKSSGSDFGKNFVAESKQAFKQAKDLGIPILSSIGAAVAPVIGAALQGVITGGAGFIGIAGGVLLASRDSRIKAAGKNLGNSLLSELTASASVFVKPMLAAIDTIQTRFKSLRPVLDSIFKNSAAMLAPLTDGVLRSIEGIFVGLDKAIKNAGPAVKALADGFADVGVAVGDLFATLAEDPEAGVAGIKALFATLTAVVNITGPLINALSDVNQFFNDMGIFAGGALIATDKLFLSDSPGTFAKHIKEVSSNVTDLATIMSVVNTAFEETYSKLTYVTEQSKQGADATSILTQTIIASGDAAKGTASALDDLASAQLAGVDPAFGLLRAQNDLTEAQKNLNKAIKDNGKNSPEAAEALRVLAEKAIGVEAAVGKAAESLNGEMDPALRSTLQSAGFTEDQIKELEKQFKKAKTEGDKFAKTYAANAKVNGIGSAKKSIYSLQDALRDVPRSVSIAMRITGVTNVSKAAAAIRKNYATGGIVSTAATGGIRENQVLVGEYGPEMVDLPSGSRVNSAGSTQAMMAKSGGPGSQDVVLRVEAADNDASRFIATMIRKYVQANSGNVQQALGQSGRG